MARILVGPECTPDRRPVAAASWRVASGPAWRRVGGKNGKGWDDCLPRSGTPRRTRRCAGWGTATCSSLTDGNEVDGCAGGVARAGGELIAAGCEEDEASGALGMPVRSKIWEGSDLGAFGARTLARRRGAGGQGVLITSHPGPPCDGAEYGP